MQQQLLHLLQVSPLTAARKRRFTQDGLEEGLHERLSSPERLAQRHVAGVAIEGGRNGPSH
jgi:hypothetical protein